MLSFPNQSEEQQQALYEDALRVYQIENTALFYMIAPSVDLRGDWELNDLTTVEESYQEGDLRDGLGFLTWVESFNDTTTEAGQIKALSDFAKYKYPVDTTVLQLRTEGLAAPMKRYMTCLSKRLPKLTECTRPLSVPRL